MPNPNENGLISLSLSIKKVQLPTAITIVVLVPAAIVLVPAASILVSVSFWSGFLYLSELFFQCCLVGSVKATFKSQVLSVL